MGAFFKVMGILLLAALLIVVSIIGWYGYKYREYFRFPDVDKAFLNNKLAKYNKAEQELLSRPDDGNIALGKLLLEFRNISGSEPFNLDFSLEGLDEQIDEKLEIFVKKTAKYGEIPDKMVMLVDKDFVLRANNIVPPDIDENPAEFYKVRHGIISFTPVILYNAIDMIKKGDTKIGVSYFRLAFHLSRALLECPDMLNALYGRNLAHKANLALLYILPELDKENILDIYHNLIKDRPDLGYAMSKGLEIETSYSMETFHNAFRLAYSEKGLSFPDNPDDMNWLLRKEYYILLNEMVSQTEIFKAWAYETSPDLPEDSVNSVKSKGLFNELMKIDYSKFNNKIVFTDNLNKAIDLAIQMEIARRSTGASGPISIIVDKDYKILLDDFKGRLVSRQN